MDNLPPDHPADPFRLGLGGGVLGGALFARGEREDVVSARHVRTRTTETLQIYLRDARVTLADPRIFRRAFSVALGRQNYFLSLIRGAAPVPLIRKSEHPHRPESSRLTKFISCRFIMPIHERQVERDLRELGE